jgi:molybdenum cofactor biosynthesis protein B
MNAPTRITPGGRIDESRERRPARIAVLTVSDTRTEANDTSGDLLASKVTGDGHTLVGRAIVPDSIESIRFQVRQWIEQDQAQVIVTTGGTGLTGRDITPEALEPLFAKRIDGFSVAFHLVSYQSVGTSTMQSRATAGVIDGCLVFCLPGSNGAVKDGWSVIGPQLDTRHAPCNLIEIMPRLLER